MAMKNPGWIAFCVAKASLFYFAQEEENYMFIISQRLFVNVEPIDLRRLSRPPPAPSTCDFMYDGQRSPSFILWWPKTEILCEPLSRSSPFKWGQRWQPIHMGHSLHIGGSRREGGGPDTILMSMVEPHCLNNLISQSKDSNSALGLLPQRVHLALIMFLVSANYENLMHLQWHCLRKTKYYAWFRIEKGK
jgi:hypothetical protein